MKTVDLTHMVKEGMPVYPGTEPPKVEIATTIDKDGFEERLLTLFSHTGTHMDAPSHILKGGRTLSDFSVADFTGRAVLIDARGMTDVTAEVLEKYTDRLYLADFAVLYTGWSAHWGTDKYFSGFPVLTSRACEMLTTFSIKGVCMDTISVDSVDTETYKNHRILFSAGIFLVENLTNLDSIDRADFTLTCLPMNIENGDGAPVRAVASF